MLIYKNYRDEKRSIETGELLRYLKTSRSEYIYLEDVSVFYRFSVAKAEYIFEAFVRKGLVKEIKKRVIKQDLK